MKRFGLLLMSLALIVVISVGAVAAQEGEPTVLRGMLSYDELPGLDPAIAQDAPSIQVLLMTYVGLTVADTATAAPEPGLAESWEIVENDDGSFTYTFHLIPEVPWVKYDAEAGEVVPVTDEDGNIRYVTAQDTVYGILRSLDPESAGEYAFLLGPYIIGADAYNNGEGAAEDVTVYAVDDYTLEIVAPSSYPWQLSIYGMWIARPQPQWVIDEYADLWQEPENYVQYGSYAVKEWIHGDSITLIKNPYWPGAEGMPQANIDELYLVFREQSVAMSMYEAGELDWLSTVPPADLDRIRADSELSQQLVTTPASCSYYYGFNVTDVPFDNVNLRKAFTYAVDREAIVDNVTRGGQTPAQWFSLPVLVAAPTLDTHPDLGVWYDPELAQEYLQAYLDEMGYASVDDIMDITLLYNTSETHAAIAQAVQQMWVETLGIEVQLTNQEFAVYLDSREDFPVWRAGWCMDYLDTNNFLYDVFHSTALTDTHWSSPEFDALVEAARETDDIDERRELYAQAENLLIYEDAAIIPFYWYVKIQMIAPTVEATYALDNAENLWEWSIVP